MDFIGVTWFNYLDKCCVPFAIRVRKGSVCDNWCSVYALFTHLLVGELRVLNNSYSIYGCKVRVVGMKLAHNDYTIIATNRAPAKAFTAYKLRWDIEMLFSALKTSSFNIESTHLAQLHKLDTLLRSWLSLLLGRIM